MLWSKRVFFQEPDPDAAASDERSKGLGSLQNFCRASNSIDPQMAEAHYLLFRLYQNLGKQELAVVQLNAFKQIRKENGDVVGDGDPVSIVAEIA